MIIDLEVNRYEYSGYSYEGILYILNLNITTSLADSRITVTTTGVYRISATISLFNATGGDNYFELWHHDALNNKQFDIKTITFNIQKMN
ncbi:MAG: hypothetical protein FJY10_09530 [Bacteroidetes bacterium]|nr:hypothetical protein [Bacteroidota bacterium]